MTVDARVWRTVLGGSADRNSKTLGVSLLALMVSLSAPVWATDATSLTSLQNALTNTTTTTIDFRNNITATTNLNAQGGANVKINGADCKSGTDVGGCTLNGAVGGTATARYGFQLSGAISGAKGMEINDLTVEGFNNVGVTVGTAGAIKITPSANATQNIAINRSLFQNNTANSAGNTNLYGSILALDTNTTMPSNYNLNLTTEGSLFRNNTSNYNVTGGTVWGSAAIYLRVAGSSTNVNMALKFIDSIFNNNSTTVTKVIQEYTGLGGMFGTTLSSGTAAISVLFQDSTLTANKISATATPTASISATTAVYSMVGAAAMTVFERITSGGASLASSQSNIIKGSTLDGNAISISGVTLNNSCNSSTASCILASGGAWGSANLRSTGTDPTMTTTVTSSDSTAGGNRTVFNNNSVLVTDAVYAAALTLGSSVISTTTTTSVVGVVAVGGAIANMYGKRATGGNTNASLDVSYTDFTDNSVNFSGNGSGTTISGMFANGGAVYSSSNSRFKDVIFTGNTVSATKFTPGTGAIWGSGGALFNDTAVMTITDSDFQTNTTTNQGGAIYNYAGTLTITDSSFSGNKAAVGGAIYDNSPAGVTSPDVVTLTAVADTSRFDQNKATAGNGGALSNNTASVLRLFSTPGTAMPLGTFSLTNNTATVYGGAIYWVGAAGSSIDLTEATISGNSAGRAGGAAYLTGTWGNVKLDRATISDNTVTAATAGSGGALGMGNLNGIFSAIGTIFRKNGFTNSETGNWGGALYLAGAPTSAVISGATFSENTADAGRGGAIYNAMTNPLKIEDSTFTGNKAGSGGAIYSTGTLYLSAQNADTTFATASDTIVTTADLYANAGPLNTVSFSGAVTGATGKTFALNQTAVGPTGGDVELNSSLTGFTGVTLGNGRLVLGGTGTFGLPAARMNLTLGDGAAGNTAVLDLTANGVVGNKVYVNNLISNNGLARFMLDFNGDKSDAIAVGGNASGTLRLDRFSLLNTGLSGDVTRFTILENAKNVMTVGLVQSLIAGGGKYYQITYGMNGNDGQVTLTKRATPYNDFLRSAIALTSGDPPINLAGGDTNLELSDSGNYVAGVWGETNMQGYDIATHTLRIYGDSHDAGHYSLSGDNQYNLLKVGTGTLNLDSLTVKDALSTGNGAAINNGGTLDLRNVILKDNVSQGGDGSGLYNAVGATATVIEAVVSTNEAQNGGAFANLGTVNLTGVTFSGNQATTADGGAVYNTGRLTLDTGNFINNKAAANGGGIYNVGMSTLDVSNFTNNEAATSGGGIYNTGTLMLSTGNFTKNKAAASGGAIYNESVLKLVDNNFTNNTAAVSGGAIYNALGGTLSVTANNQDVTFKGNTANGVSNAIENGGDLSLLAVVGRTISLYDKITGNGGLMLNGAGYGGTVALYTALSGYTGHTILDGGTLKLDGQNYLDGVNMVISNTPVLDYSNTRTGAIDVSAWTLNSDARAIVNVDLVRKTADVFKKTPGGTGSVLISGVKLLSDLAGQTDVKVADVNMAPRVDLASHYTLMGSVYKYTVKYVTDQLETPGVVEGFLRFFRTAEVNPQATHSGIAMNTTGLLTSWGAYDNVFEQSEYLSDPFTAWENLRWSEGLSTGEGYSPMNGRGWVKGGGDFGTIKLRGGPTVNANLYNLTIGVDGQGYDLAGGTGTVSAYLGYQRSDQTYQGINQVSNGVYLGLMQTWKKGNWSGAVTGLMGGSRINPERSDNFNLAYAGAAVKVGYDVYLKPRLVLRPQIKGSYTHVWSEGYTSIDGAQIGAGNMDGIQIAPEVRLVAALPDRWHPYIQMGYSFNRALAGSLRADAGSLPCYEVRSYAEYKLGVEKSWSDRTQAFAQINAQQGGINTLGFRLGVRTTF